MKQLLRFTQAHRAPLRVRSLPGVNPKPLFGPNLDSTVASQPKGKLGSHVKRSTGHTHTHTHTHTDTEQHPDTHTHTTRTTPQTPKRTPPTNTERRTERRSKVALLARATSHARVGGRAEVSVGDRVGTRLKSTHTANRHTHTNSRMWALFYFWVNP